MTQIDQAVTEIDRNTQETAALMEEAGAAATSLLSQAALMSSSVSRYRARDAGIDNALGVDGGDLDQAA